ncbi:unnamed protein product [Camellia sinensis]
MVKAKHQKSKSKSTKQPHIKKHGKQGDISDIRAQLDAFGLKIIQVTADGNYNVSHSSSWPFLFFCRALADQLDASEEEHEKYRSMIAVDAYVAPNVVLAGQVTVCDGASVWNGSVLRGDLNKITVGFCSNVQERCVVHAAWSSPTGLPAEILIERFHSIPHGKNREMFEPFIEDEVPFDEYCQSMEKDGTWAGHMELQAASLVTHSNICIHRISSPRWYIQNFDNREARMVHLSYHDGEHYNSVRLKEDTCTGPARPIIIKADADLSATSRQAKVAVTKSKGGAGKNFIHAEAIKLVMSGGGCEDAKKVEQVLQQVDGDVDAAIEFLIAEEGNKEYLVESDKLPCPADTSHGNGRYLRDNENGNYEQHKEELKDNSSTPESSCDQERTHDDKSSLKDEKKIPRNKVCPCGSKKKYKACCGSISGISSAKFVISTKQLTMVRVERKENKVRKVVLLMLQARMDLKEGHLMWVHSVFEWYLKKICKLLQSEEINYICHGRNAAPTFLFMNRMPDHGREQLSLQNDLMPVETRIGDNFLYKATTVIAAADQIAFHILGVLEAFFSMETHNFAVQWPDKG